MGIKYIDKNQELTGKIRYERGKNLSTMLSPLLKTGKQKWIGTN